MSGRGGQTRGSGEMKITSESKSTYEIDLPPVKPSELRGKEISYKVTTPNGTREAKLHFYRKYGIRDVSIFAGGITGSRFRDAAKYVKEYPGTRIDNGVKVKGTAFVSLFGRRKKSKHIGFKTRTLDSGLGTR